MQVLEASIDEELTPSTGDVQTRPTSPVKDEISFLWERGVKLVDLLYSPKGGLAFIIDTDGHVISHPLVDNYKVAPWIQDWVKNKFLKLPSCAHFKTPLTEIVRRMDAYIEKYFDCSEQFRHVAVMFAVATWIYETFSAFPYLRFLGLPGCGKSRGAETIGALCNRPLSINRGVSLASLFRLIDAIGPTLILDEADFDNSHVGSEITSMLNSGYEPGRPVVRSMQNSDSSNYTPTSYNVYGPKIISGRKRFKDEATESRCLSYRPTPTSRTDIPLQLNQSFHDEALEIRNALLGFRIMALRNGVNVDVEANPLLMPRTNQIIAPLVVVAKLLKSPEREQYLSDMLAFAVHRDQNDKQDLRLSHDALVVQAYLRCKDNNPTCTDLGKEMLKVDSTLSIYDVTARKVGTLCRELGFDLPHTKRGACPQIIDPLLKDLCKRYGLNDAKN